MSIHKKRRKVEICHNCHTILSAENNFCPHCGQENHDLKVPIGHLAFEVFEGFTHFDTKFYNTMRAIFLSPGKITKDFLEGRRGRYVPPVRLYFLISFVFFLGLGSMVDLALKESNNFLTDFIDGAVTISTTDDEALKVAKEELKNIDSPRDTTGLSKAKNKVRLAEIAVKNNISREEKLTKTKKSSKIILEELSEVGVGEVLDEMNIQKNDTLRKLIFELPTQQQQQKRLIDIQKQIMSDSTNTEEMDEVSSQMRNYFTEKIGKKRQLQYLSNLYALKNNASIKVKYDADTIIIVKGSDGSLQNTAYLKRILTMDNRQIDDVNEKNGTNIFGIKFLSRGFIKNLTYYQLSFNEDAQKASSELAHLFVGVFSVMMFILMPIVALLLKIIYSKRSHSILSYPFRLTIYFWDWLMYSLKFKKVRKYKHIPHVFFGHTRYYYEHLIFSIHIHAVFFLMLIIFVGGGIVIGYGGQIFLITVAAFLIYSIISLKTVYRQGILKTLFKSIILFFLYSVSFIVILTLTGVFKFALS